MSSEAKALDIDSFSMMEHVAGELGPLELEGWFAYDGYNPKETLKVMSEIEPDHNILIHDVKVCAYFAMNRGNKPSKAMQKMHDDGIRILRNLIQKYNIIQTSPTSKSDITILRVAGICPLFCAQICFLPETRAVGAKPESLPKCLTFSGAPGLIPSDRQDLYALWLEWAMNFNQVIANGRNSDKVDFFGRVIHDAGYLTDQQRYEALNKLSVV
jgi:hypothetical protein